MIASRLRTSTLIPDVEDIAKVVSIWKAKSIVVWRTTS